MASEKDIIKLVDEMYQSSHQSLAKVHDEWTKRYKYWRAKNVIKRPSYKDNVRIPLIFMISDGLQAILTDNNPKFIFLPQEEGDIDTADNLNQIIGDYYWDKMNLSRMSEEAIWWAINISGSAFAKCGIDPITYELYVKTINPFGIYPDPSALTMKDLQFFDYVEATSLNKLKTLYPDRAKYLKPNDDVAKYEYGAEPILSPWITDDNKIEVIKGIYSDQIWKKQYGRTLIHEIWIKSYDEEKIPVPEGEIEYEHDLFRHNQIPEVKPEQNHPEHIRAHKNFLSSLANLKDSEQIPTEFFDKILDHIEEHMSFPQKEKRLKYPQGKIIIKADDILLDEKPAPFGLNYAKLDAVINPRSFWASTLMEYGQSLQDSRERRKRQISDNADKMANLREFYNVLSGYDPDKVSGNAAETIGVRGDPRAAVYHPTQPPLPAYISEDALDSERLTEKILNYNEVLQGIYPKGSPSGVTINSLQEAMGPRIRKISKHFEWFLREVARGIISMLPYEDPKKVFAILGKDRKPIYLNKDDLNISGEYDIRIISGSTLPTSRMAKERRAMELVNAGIYDREAALTYLDDPQKVDIIQRTSIIEQQKALINSLMQRVKMLEQSQGVSNEQQTQDAGAPEIPGAEQEQIAAPKGLQGNPERGTGFAIG